MKQVSREPLITELQAMMGGLPEVRGKGFHYPKALKSIASDLLESGVSPKELSALTGINSSTLSDWKTKSPRRFSKKFEQVKVTPPSTQVLSIKTAQGHAVSGFSISDLGHLLKLGAL